MIKTYIIIRGATQTARFTFNALPSVFLDLISQLVSERQARGMSWNEEMKILIIITQPS